jgi:hypothetical protein
VIGLVQLAAAAVSSWQLKVEPDSLELNEKVAALAFVGFAGFEPIVTAGAVVSTVHV